MPRAEQFNRLIRDAGGRPLPRVIFLNGASSAGKTTLGRALQDQLKEPFLLLGLDTCFDTVPAKWAGGPPGPYAEDGFAYTEMATEDGHPVLAITYGPVGWRILSGFHRAVAGLLQAGNSVIIDEMLLGERVRDDWLEVLHPFQPFLVAVTCEIEELERRERTRTSRPGLARWSARQAHVGVTYDLIVDTTRSDAMDLAALIAARMG